MLSALHRRRYSADRAGTMSSFLNLERYAEPNAPEAPESARAPAVAPADAPHPDAVSHAVSHADEDFADFEIVVGRRQIAGASLVAIVLLAVFSGVFYLIGKSMGPAAAVAATPAPVVQAPVGQVPVTQTAPTTPSPVPQAIVAEPAIATAPVFAAAIPGKVYLQVGAIEKGLAGIWAEGLRTHGLDAFVAPGPSDKEWRVLIGPMPDPKAFQRAKDTLDRLGVLTFGRRYSPSITEAASPPAR
jgi:hypothetical protein